MFIDDMGDPDIKDSLCAAIFNIELTKEYQVNKTHSYKILHIFSGCNYCHSSGGKHRIPTHHMETLIVITDREGEKAFTNLMKRLFLFKVDES